MKVVTNEARFRRGLLSSCLWSLMIWYAMLAGSSFLGNLQPLPGEPTILPSTCDILDMLMQQWQQRQQPQ